MGRKKRESDSFYKIDEMTGSYYYERQTFESKKAGDSRLPEIKNEPHADIFLSMVLSDAWANLTGNAVKLYHLMKMQAYSKNKEKNIPKNKRMLGKADFYFNKALIMHAYPNMYSSMSQFYRDRDCLIENGFIDRIYHSNSPTEKDIFRLSDRWQNVDLKKRKSSVGNANKAWAKKKEKQKAKGK